MNAAQFRRIAQHCRELMRRTRSEAASEQLRIWADEFDACAERLERDGARNRGEHGC